ncbi:MAG: response regulator transcription factor [Anaerolineales bacterium]|nr:response regulator transcription factor [Anaerolineales bacterium]
MSIKILVVDDEPRFVRLVDVNLKTEGYQVVVANNGTDGLDLVVKEKPNLVLLDVMMPEIDGFEVLTRIREFSNVPVIMLTAKGEEVHRVRGLDLGADDYIVKPFSANELLARVRAVIRRATQIESFEDVSIFEHGSLMIDFARAEVNVDGESIFLSATEYRLLLQFAHNLGQILTAEDLLVNVWGEEYKKDKEILWVCISRLRQKLEENPKQPVHIVTKSGAGYTMPVL